MTNIRRDGRTRTKPTRAEAQAVLDRLIEYKPDLISRRLDLWKRTRPTGKPLSSEEEEDAFSDIDIFTEVYIKKNCTLPPGVCPDIMRNAVLVLSLINNNCSVPFSDTYFREGASS